MAFMGGAGAMARWVAATPPLAREDHLHFRRRGSATRGQALCDALMKAYDDRLLAPAGIDTPGE
jgi:hypothetical protein